MDNVLDLGEVETPDWSQTMNPRAYIPFREAEGKGGPRAAFILHDIAFIRSAVRRRRNGEDRSGGTPFDSYRVAVVWPNGETASWVFDDSVSWPVEDGVKRDWRSDWLETFGGAA